MYNLALRRIHSVRIPFKKFRSLPLCALGISLAVEQHLPQSSRFGDPKDIGAVLPVCHKRFRLAVRNAKTACNEQQPPVMHENVFALRQGQRYAPQCGVAHACAAQRG